MSVDFQTTLEETADQVTIALDRLLPRVEGPEAHLISAMRYAALGPGKRMRPFLTIECGRLTGVDERALLRMACAIECIHAYSLIHDDLPAMDNDDLRRGRDTVHVAYDEATAILAGDGLQSLAFEIVSNPETCENAKIRCTLIEKLARASGPSGMVGGQMIDIVIEQADDIDMGVVSRCQRMKTGALIVFCAEVAVILASSPKPMRLALDNYASDLGLCYQIVDDLLDAEGHECLTGKRTGKDIGQGKANFVSILGVDDARERAKYLAEQAVGHLKVFGSEADLLRQTVSYVLERKA